MYRLLAKRGEKAEETSLKEIWAAVLDPGPVLPKGAAPLDRATAPAVVRTTDINGMRGTKIETDRETIEETGTETTVVSNTETTTGHRRRPKRRNGDFRTGQTLPPAPIGSSRASPNPKRKRIPRY